MLENLKQQKSFIHFLKKKIDVEFVRIVINCDYGWKQMNVYRIKR